MKHCRYNCSTWTNKLIMMLSLGACGGTGKSKHLNLNRILVELTVDWIYQLMLATGLKMHGPVGNWRASALKLLLACVLLGYVGVGFRCAQGSEVL